MTIRSEVELLHMLRTIHIFSNGLQGWTCEKSSFFFAVQIEKTEINILQKNGKKSFFTFLKEKEENYFKTSTDFRARIVGVCLFQVVISHCCMLL